MTEFPPHGGSDTSFDAAMSMEEITGFLRKLVYAAIKLLPRTCDELEVALDMRHQTCSARIYELHRKQWIHDSGRRRRTRSGRDAIVWAVTEQHDRVDQLEGEKRV